MDSARLCTGLLLFIIFISDIDRHPKFSIASYFTDDTRVVKEVKSQSDYQKLHDYLNENFNLADESMKVINLSQ